MKKALWITLAAVALLAAAAVAALGAAAGRFKPLAEKKLSEALARPVTVREVSLGWKSGPVFAARGVVVGDPAAPDTAIASVDAAPDLWPLLSGEVVLKRLFVSGLDVHLTKTAKGVLLGDRPLAAGKPEKAGGGARKSFRVDLFKIERAKIRWTDETADPPLDVTVREFDLLVRRFDSEKGFDAEGSAAVFAERPNAGFRASVDLAAGRIRTLDADADFGKMDARELYAALPAVERLHMRKRPAGVATLSVENAPFEGFPGGGKARVGVRKGSFYPKELPAPLEDVTLDASIDGALARVETFSASYAGGRLAAEATLEGLGAAAPAWRAKLSARSVPVDALLPPRPQGAPRLQGDASLDFEGAARGLSWPEIAPTLEGAGKIALEKGALLNLNATRDVVEKLARVPGVGRIAVTPEVHARMSEPHTALAPFAADFQVRGGALVLPGAQVDSGDFSLVGAGTVGLAAGELNLQTRLFLSRALSSTAAGAVPELAALADANGRIEIPVRLGGTAARPAFSADVQSIVSRVAASRGQDLIVDLLRRKQGGGETGQVASTEGESPSYAQFLKNLF